jgi:hypothetical protein
MGEMNELAKKIMPVPSSAHLKNAPEATCDSTSSLAASDSISDRYFPTNSTLQLHLVQDKV